MDLAHFIGQYGYAALFAGTLIEGETFLVLAGLAASRGYLDLGTVIAVAFVGALLSCQVCFHLGRRIGPRILEGIPNSAGAAARVRRLAERYPALIVIGIHFLYGVRTVGLFVIGMSGVSGWQFFWLNAIGSLMQVSIVATLGYVFGNAIHALLVDLDQYDHWVFGGLALIALLGWVGLRLKHRYAPRQP